MNREFIENAVTKGAMALGGIAVDGVSGLLKGGMEEREMGEDKIDALDTVTEVCKDMVPDMASKAAMSAVNKMFDKTNKELGTTEVNND